MNIKQKSLNVAIVHDYLTTYGGAERVLEELHNIWPAAKIYTATADYGRMGIFAGRFKNLNIKTSWAQNIPIFVKMPLLYRFLLPMIWSSINIGNPDIVISSSGSNMAKGVRIPKKAIHICYCYTPPRFLHGLGTETNYLNIPIFKLLTYPFFLILKHYDLKTNEKVNLFIADSQTVKLRINKFYKNHAVVIYPPCEIPDKFNEVKSDNYYLVVSRLVKYKNVDLIVKAFKTLKLPLKIIGKGRDLKELKKMAANSKNIEFLGEVHEKKLRDAYKKCKALVVATKNEDFGMTIPEASGCGKPVIAYFSGGLKETVVNGKTGIFFYKLNEKNIVSAVHKFEKMKFDPKAIWLFSQKFSKKTFKRNIKSIVEKMANNRKSI